jgi:2'-5' RNA ligase
MMDCPRTCVLALEPDDAFARQVVAYKEQVGRRVGEQLYADHPPHLTLYLAVFDRAAGLTGPIGSLCRRLAAPTAAISGWHVFEGDHVTGQHTLVCNVAPESRPALHEVQQETIAVAAPLRKSSDTRACYDESWRRLSEEERVNVARFGFPFVGPIWHPHVTVASIRPEHWEAVWAGLAGTPPRAMVRFPYLSIYGLRDGEPFLVERFSLEAVE